MTKQFRWRLDTVKKVKEREADAARVAFGLAQRTLIEEESAMATLKSKRDQQNARLRSNHSGPLDAADLQATHAFVQSLTARIEAQTEKIERTRQVLAQKRRELEEAVKEEKVLANLRERDQRAHRQEARKQDQAKLDETAGRRAFDKKREENEL